MNAVVADDAIQLIYDHGLDLAGLNVFDQSGEFLSVRGRMMALAISPPPLAFAALGFQVLDDAAEAVPFGVHAV